MPKAKLTKDLMSKAAPEDREYVIWDTEIDRLGLRVLPSGRKVFVFQYRINRKPRKYTIGPSDLSLNEVRKISLGLAAKVARGIDPATEREDARNAISVRELADRFDAAHITFNVKNRTAVEYRRALRNDILPALGRKAVSDVTSKDIHNLHFAMRARPIQANRTYEIVRKMFNLAEEWGYRLPNTNPCRGLKRNREYKCERFLSDAEMKRLSEVLGEMEAERVEMPSAIAAVRLLVLTGCRLNEIMSLAWAYVDLGARVLRLPDSKTGRKSVQLSSAAVQVLEAIKATSNNQWVIAGKIPDQPLTDLQPFWRRVRARAGLVKVRIHDLRHTFASYAASGGMSLHTVGKLLGHKSLQSTHRYAHLTEGTMRTAADQVGDVLGSLMSLAANDRSEAPA